MQKWLFFPWAAFSACFRVPVPLNRGGVLTCTPRRKPLCGKKSLISELETYLLPIYLKDYFRMGTSQMPLDSYNMLNF
jgi:hypothetical protein